MNNDSNRNTVRSETWDALLPPPIGGEIRRGHIEQLIKTGVLDPNSTIGSSQTPLSWAIKRGDKWLVELLLDHNVEADHKDQEGCTPLMHAIRPLADRKKRKTRHSDNWRTSNDPSDIVKLLVGNKSVNPDSMDNQGRTPLSKAVQYGNIKIAKFLLENCGVEKDRKDNSGRSPLLWASACGHEEAVKLLLEKSVSLDSIDNQGRTPLSWAAERGHSAIINLLLQPYCTKITPDLADKNGRTPLSWASACGHEEIVRLLLEKSVSLDSIDNQGRTPLSWAAERGHSAIIKLLLQPYCTKTTPDLADNNGRTPLSWAAEAGQLDSLALLLGSDEVTRDHLDQDGRTPLSRAAEYGHDKIIEILLKYDSVKPDQKDKHGRTPLSWAVCSPGKVPKSSTMCHRTVKLLLEQADVDPNTRDNTGRAPLWWAADGNHVEVVKLLLAKSRINPAPTTADNLTPLAHAVELEHKDVVKHLVLRDSSTLHLLARIGNLSLVKLLLESGYKVDTKNNLNQTPLHVAASKGHLEIAEHLVSKRAVIENKDVYGRTPLRLAVKHKHQGLIEMLLQYGAQTVGIMKADWIKVKAFRVGLVILRRLDQTISLHFLQDLKQIPVELEQTIRLVLLPDFCTWRSSLDLKPTDDPQPDISPIFHEIQKLDKYVRITVTGCYPIIHNPENSQSFQRPEWGRCGISWTMTSPTVAEAQPSFQPIEYCSTLPYGWIPENGTDFFALFMKFLKEKWLETCKQAEEHLENRRRQQLHKKGDDPRFIFHLAEDAKTRAKLRNILRNQIRGIKKLVTEYHDSYSESPIPQLSHKQIESFDVEINDEFGQLEQSIKDLLHFEFSWASINEAHRSTSIATSIKRLSWITFIFLPAMFASSLFGMNVDILERNPDWRWYIVFGLGFIAVTFFAWLILKYGQVEDIVEQEIGGRLQRFFRKT